MSAYADIKSAKTQFAANDVLYGKLRPNLNKVHLANRAGICSTDILAFRFASSDLAYLYSHYLRTQAFNTAAVSTMAGQQLPRTSWEKLSPIPVPDFSTIDIPPLRAAMQALEAKIHAAQTVIDAAPAAKQAILQKHL